MNTRFTLSITACLFLTPFLVLNAQTTTASSSSGGIIENVIQNVSDIKDTVQEHLPSSISERNISLQRRTEERIINLAANISNRLDGVTARLQNISNRLNIRLEKQAADGYDVSAAKVSLEAANTSLNSARSQMNGIDGAVKDAIGSNDPRGEWAKVRAKFITARDEIRTAHTELKNTVSNLKNAPRRSAQNSEQATPETPVQ